MSEEQIIRTWLVLGVISLILLFIGALTKKTVVYRDYSDLGWSVTIVVAPLLSLLLISLIAGDETDPIMFATDFFVGQVIMVLTGITLLWAIKNNYQMSIQDNGLVLGVFVGTAKLIIAAIIALCSIGLINSLFQDKRKLGHVAIFFILFAILSWVVTVLVNGEKVNRETTQ